MTAANNPNFNPEKYTTIASNHLVVYSIHSLYKDGDEISAEDIISTCFMLFPKKFSLRTYPQWPDSALIGRRLHDCERSGWLIARINTGFKLTAKGIRLAERVAKELGVAIPRKEKPKQVHKLQVDKLRVAEAKPVGELQVDKLQVTETAEPAPVAPKPEEEAKAPVVKAPKPVEKVVMPAEKLAPVKPKPAKKVKTPAVKKPKAVEKKATTSAKPAPVKPKPEEKAKALVVEAPKPVEKVVTPIAKPAPIKPKVGKAKEKRVDKLRVTETEKPSVQRSTSNVPPKVEQVEEKQVTKLQVTEKAKPAPVKPKPEEKAKAPVVEAPKPVKKVVKPVAKPAPIKSKPAKKIVKSAVKITPVKTKAKTPVVKAPKPVKKGVTPAAKPAPAKPKPATKTIVPVFKPKAKAPKPVIHAQPKKRVDEVKVAEAVKPDVQRSTFNVKPISAEEKARAGKFVKMMEGSDAYRLYKKNGANAQIGEFDFRSLLLCTMESSHETLARNVELFKGYAGIHNRQDLTAFLGFCAEKFAHLLMPEKKAVRKLK